MSQTGLSPTEEAEVQQLLVQQQLDQNVHRIADACWDKCMTYADKELKSGQSTCLTNCTERFIDTTLLLTQHFNNRLSNMASSSSNSFM